MTTPNQSAAANPTIASQLHSWRPLGRVAELGSLGGGGAEDGQRRAEV